MKSNNYRHSTDSADLHLIYESAGHLEYGSDGCSAQETDDADAETPAEHKIHKIWKKIENTKEDLVRLQAIKDENVTQYLRSTDNISEADRNSKTKLNFERNNQKTNASIQLLQRKLEKYHYQVKDVEEHGVQGSKTIMKTVQDHVRSGASSISDAVSKPLESFNNFMKKEKKSSSTDNVFVFTSAENEDESGGVMFNSLISTSDEEHVSSGSASNVAISQQIAGRISSIRTEHTEDEWENMKCRIQKLENQNKETKDDIDFYKDALNRMLLSLQEERYKTEQVQGVLNDLFNQWNDLIELHQNEMMGVKEEMQHTLERIECVEYRFTERTAELHENVESCLTRISKQEKQSQEQQQPIDTYLSIDAKMIITKLLSFFINICVVCIYVITKLSRLLMPFVSTKIRLGTTAIAFFSFIILWRNADPEVVSIFIFIFIMIHCVYQIIS